MRRRRPPARRQRRGNGSDTMDLSDKGRAAVESGAFEGLSDDARLAAILVFRMPGGVTRANLTSLMAEVLTACNGNAAVAIELIEGGFIGVEPVGKQQAPE